MGADAIPFPCVVASDVVVKVTPLVGQDSPDTLLLEPLCPGVIGLPILTLIRARSGHRKFCFDSLTSDWAFKQLRTECFLDAKVPWKPLT